MIFAQKDEVVPFSTSGGGQWILQVFFAINNTGKKGGWLGWPLCRLVDLQNRSFYREASSLFTVGKLMQVASRSIWYCNCDCIYQTQTAKCTQPLQPQVEHETTFEGFIKLPPKPNTITSSSRFPAADSTSRKVRRTTMRTRSTRCFSFEKTSGRSCKSLQL